jgi:hypothetical protein
MWFALAISKLTTTDREDMSNEALYSGERNTVLKAIKQGFHALKNKTQL